MKTRKKVHFFVGAINVMRRYFAPPEAAARGGSDGEEAAATGRQRQRLKIRQGGQRQRLKKRKTHKIALVVG